jgi:hypothetical protein
MKKISILSFIILGILITCCTSNNNQRLSGENNDSIIGNSASAVLTQGNDSIELTDLVRKMYTWHEAAFKNQDDFPAEEKKPSDSLYRRLDWNRINGSIKKLEASNFFTKKFIETYRDIANYIDKKLRDGSVIWRDGDLPPFPGYESDPWCSCQDYPTDNWNWKQVTIKNLRIDKENANFIWFGREDFKYKLGAKKENNAWKINSLEGFSIDRYLVLP